MPHDIFRLRLIGSQRGGHPSDYWTALLASTVWALILLTSTSAQVRGEEPFKPADTKPADSLPPPINTSVPVTIEARIYELSQSDFAMLDFGQFGMKVPTPSSAAAGTTGQALTPILRVGSFDVSAAIKKIPSVEQLSSSSVTTFSGKVAKIVLGQDMRFPNAIPIRGSTDSQPQMSSSSPPPPWGAKSRFVGIELEATATVAADGKTIAFSVSPTSTRFKGFVEYGGSSVAVASGSSLTAPSGFFEPVFGVRSTHADVTLQAGATLVVGLADTEMESPPYLEVFHPKGEAKEIRALLVFITVNIPGK